VNLNKLFPRLGIRTKLGVAFAVLALVPLLLVALLTTEVTIKRLREIARTTIQHDVEVAARDAERALGLVETDVGYLAAMIPTLAAHDVDRTIAGFLRHTPALLQVRVVAPDGVVEHTVRRDGRPATAGGSGTYYATRAAELTFGGRLALAVELRGEGGGDHPIPAVAVIVPIWDSAGMLQRVLVGEAAATALFAGLGQASPHYEGVTALLDSEGWLLYHSERKADWSSLLARLELPGGAAADGDSAVARAVFGPGEWLASSAALHLGNGPGRSLRLLRGVPVRVVDAPVREFLAWVGMTGGLVVAVVLTLAILAAAQFTEPIYALRQAVAQLARGEPASWRLDIASNDELEDLAGDFATMAEALTTHRQGLEQLVVERTHQLHEAHAELAGILEHSADAIIGVDRTGRVRLWNRGAERLFGWSAAEVMGGEVDDLLLPPGEDLRLERQFIATALGAQGYVANLRTRRVTRQGTTMPVSLTQTNITDPQGRLQGASLIVRDTSNEARLEEQMRRSERLSVAHVMAAGLAHDLNTPLAIIGNRLELMQSELGEAQEGMRRDVQVLRQHVARLNEIAGNLLRFARDDDTGGGTVPVNLPALTRQIATLLERPLVQRNVRLVVDSPDEGHVVAAGRMRAMESVLVNLVLNAADAMPRGGTVRLEARRLSSDQVVLQVEDQGPGVPVELRARIFEPFFTTKDAQHGTGLGLALCRTIVEGHGGRIWVEDAPEGGARFIVLLPAAPEAV
jgi:PAS domain S-box-containing protein